MKASDLELLRTLSRPTLHPDATRAVVAVGHPDLGSDSAVGQLWSVPLDGGSPRRITRGKSDRMPAFSPDGALIAFLRAVDGTPQLHIADAADGEALTITDAALGVDDYRWAPDSRRIAFTARVAEPGRYGTVDDLPANAEPPRRITTLKYRANGLGYTNDRRRHAFLIAVPDVHAEPAYTPAPSAADPSPRPPAAVPEPVRLTEGDFDHSAFSWAPDGLSLAVVSARHGSRDLDLVDEVVSVTTDGALQSLLGHEHRLGIRLLDFAPDGTLYLVAAELGESGTDFIGRSEALYELGPAGPTRLTEPESHDLGESGALSFSGGRVLVAERARGRQQLLAVDGRAVQPLTGGDLLVTATDAAGQVIVATVVTPHSAGELAVVGADGLRVLTGFSHELAETGIAAIDELEVSAPDGHPVHGWTMTPAGAGPHPVLLNIHGGPFAQYGVGLFDEMQVYVDAGYAVVMCNPRGAAGYGQEHARAIRQRMGTADLDDVIAFLDGALAAHPDFDADRVGIMGGSYGGYLTAWAIAHDHRFAAAIVERGYLDPEAFVGTSDIGSFFSDEYTGTDPERIRAQSPQAVVGQVRTPTLIIHSADDLRCPLSQGERYYAALKRNGVEAELLIFPGENHELTRGGRPRHRLQRFEAVLDWWSRHLPVDGGER